MLPENPAAEPRLTPWLDPGADRFPPFGDGAASAGTPIEPFGDGCVHRPSRGRWLAKARSFSDRAGRIKVGFLPKKGFGRAAYPLRTVGAVREWFALSSVHQYREEASPLHGSQAGICNAAKSSARVMGPPTRQNPCTALECALTSEKSLCIAGNDLPPGS